MSRGYPSSNSRVIPAQMSFRTIRVETSRNPIEYFPKRSPLANYGQETNMHSCSRDDTEERLDKAIIFCYTETFTRTIKTRRCSLDNLLLNIVVFVVFVIFGSSLYFALRKLRMVPGADESLYRNGYRWPTITHDVPMWVIPPLHLIYRISHKVREIALDPRDEYVSKDRKFLTIGVVIHVSVEKNADAIVNWVRATGGKDTSVAASLLEDKLRSVTRLSVSGLTSKELIGTEHALVDAIRVGIEGDDLASLGLTLNDIHIVNIRDTGKTWGATA